MLSFIHRRLGAPAEVLEQVEVPAPNEPGPRQVRIRVAYVTIHPGDLQLIEGAAGSGGPYAVDPAGRTPGFEGAGIIDAVGADIAPGLGLHVGARVVYFPVRNGWSEWVLADADCVVPVPATIDLQVAAQTLINTATAELIIRAGHTAWPDHLRDNVTVIQTGAASAVGRIITALLTERGVDVIRLVRSAASARYLLDSSDARPVIATEAPGWQEALTHATAGKPLHVAVDGVGGQLLPVVAGLLAVGGTIINYGALGGALTDIQLVVPRGLTIQGVHIGQWLALPVEQRQTDIATALRLAAERPELFHVTAIFPPRQFKQAMEQVRHPTRSGAVLIAFQTETQGERA